MARYYLLLAALLWCVMLLVIVLWLIHYEQPTADLAATELHQQFRDWQTAEKRFVGKSIVVRGRVLQVGTSWLAPHGWKMVQVGEPDAVVYCFFEPKNAAVVERLEVGQDVVIRGICYGEFAGLPLLKDCTPNR